jgi:hypothetical protein
MSTLKTKLKSLRVWTKYVKNVKRKNDPQLADYILSNPKESNDISFDFIWSESPEGHVFWMEINNKLINNK